VNAEPIEWGSIAQWVGPWVSSGVAIFIASWAAFRQHDQKTIDDMKARVDRLRTEMRADAAAMRADIGRVFERQDRSDQRLSAVEIEVEHLPTQTEMHQLAVKVTEIAATIQARFEAIGGKLDLVIQQNERAQDRLADKEGGR